MSEIDNLFDCFDETSETSTNTAENKATTEIINEVDDKGIKREHNEIASDDIAKRFKFEEFEDINNEEFKNRIVVHTIESLESCTHEVACPPGQEYIPLQPNTNEPVKKYNFKLDPFQAESILCVDNNQSVLVSAHTSAGKTVVAEYAIATSLRNKQRVIYTTPIKALSNQKYREFHEEFKDVGLVTGDVTINPSASCLIMTTEILRNMLYRGSEIMREVGWVVFDEIHYMRDKERGVVWEETLILLPHNVHFVFLSATIPNARQFAEWVAHLHQQPCHVIYTDYRPTPLQHYVFPCGSQGIHMVVDENGVFKEENYTAALAVIQNAGDNAKKDQFGRRGGVAGKDPTQTNIYKILKMIMERNLAPVIIFSFSKKDCELFAMQMKKLDFNTTVEKQLVDEVYNNAMDVLNEEDRHLPQVENLLPLLRRGIAIHHGGLLPILKETIEILFGEGLIKALFATETFAMGLNMPARTVLFTGMKKFDGQTHRWVTSGEYIQMSGRAGRRGIDDKGIIILMMDEKVPAAIGRDIVRGAADPINSAFHLTYNMVLNLLRVEEINPEYMLERSFFQFQNQSSIPGLCENYSECLKQYESYKFNNEPEIAEYYNIRTELDNLGHEFRSYIRQPSYLVPFLTPGRLAKIKVDDNDFGWCVVVNFRKTSGSQNPRNPSRENTTIQIELLMNVVYENGVAKPCLDQQQQNNEIDIVSVSSNAITDISSVRLFCPSDLRSSDAKKGLYKAVKEVKKRFPDGPPLLDPINDMKIVEEAFKTIVSKIKNLEKRLYEHRMHNKNDLYNRYKLKMECLNKLTDARKKLLEAKSVLQLDELKCRKRVLRRLGYCTNADVIQLKGRVACELSSADELLLTEMIFNGVFGPLSPAQACAVLSCFVFDEKCNNPSPLPEELSGPLREMQDLARRIAKVSNEARLTLEEDAYVEQFKPFLMDVVFAWCNGATFANLCKMTEIFEGSIIRCMRRLEELLRQMVQASKTIGNTDLEDKFNTAIKMIKRDIIFASSLYL